MLAVHRFQAPALLSRTTFKLPDFVRTCPFPLRKNSHLSPIGDESNAWISTFGIHPNDAHRRAYESCAFALLVSYCYPHATQERFRILCDFINALFSFDDLMDEEHLVRDVNGTKAIMDVAMNALWHPETFKTNHRIGEALQSFWLRAIQHGCAPGTQRRFLEYMDHYCCAVLEQVTNRSKNHIMDVESFTRMRRDTGALKICFVMGEFGLGLNLPDSVFEHPLIKTMEDCSNDVVVLSNDVYSWNIEQAQGHTANIITVLMNQKNISVHAAMNLVDAEVHKRFRLYLSCKSKLPSWGDAVDTQILAYCTVLEDWMAGAFSWSLESQRYFGKNAPMVRKSLTVKILPREYKTATDLRVADADSSPSSSRSASPAPVAVSTLSKNKRTVMLWQYLYLVIVASLLLAVFHTVGRTVTFRTPYLSL